MNIRFLAKNVEIPNDLKEYMEGKLTKLERFFPKIFDVQVAVRLVRGVHIVEVTANVNNVIMRGEEKDQDLRKAFDLGLKNLERRIRRHKEYLVDRAHFKTEERFSFEPIPDNTPAESHDDIIVKTKHFDMSAMTPQEASMQMELLGHTFFVFYDADSGLPNVIYKRNDGGYGLLIPKV